MCDIKIESNPGKCRSVLYINGRRPPKVVEFSITWKCDQELPILEVKRWKTGEDGNAYTLGDGYIADLVEYYPVHSLDIT